MSTSNHPLRELAQATNALSKAPYPDKQGLLAAIVLHNVGHVVNSFVGIRGSLYSAREALIGEDQHPVLLLSSTAVAYVRELLNLTDADRQVIISEVLEDVWTTLNNADLRQAFETLDVSLRFGELEGENVDAIYLVATSQE